MEKTISGLTELFSVNQKKAAVLFLFLLTVLLVMPGTSAAQSLGVLTFDKGTATGFYELDTLGYAVHVANSPAIIIKGVRIYGCKWGDDSQDAKVTVSIWDDKLNTLYQDQIPYSSIPFNSITQDQKCSDVAKWVDIPLPDHTVSGSFYLTVFTDSTPVVQNQHGISIGYSTGSTHKSSHTTKTNPNLVYDATLTSPETNERFEPTDIDWMIRIPNIRTDNGKSPVTATVSGPGGSQIPLIWVLAGGIIVLGVIAVIAYLVVARRKQERGLPAAAAPAPAAVVRSGTSHHDVFISYAHGDKPVADAACAKLEARHIRCWMAPRDVPPGTDFPAAIIRGIEESRVMVLVFSSHSNVSPHVLREITSAVNKGIIIVPFRIEDITPSKSMEYLISVPHWLDAITPPMEQHLDTLVVTVEKILSENPRQEG